MTHLPCRCAAPASTAPSWLLLLPPTLVQLLCARLCVLLQVSEVVLQQLEDASGDISGLAVKWWVGCRTQG